MSASLHLLLTPLTDYTFSTHNNGNHSAAQHRWHSVFVAEIGEGRAHVVLPSRVQSDAEVKWKHLRPLALFTCLAAVLEVELAFDFDLFQKRPPRPFCIIVRRQGHDQ